MFFFNVRFLFEKIRILTSQIKEIFVSIDTCGYLKSQGRFFINVNCWHSITTNIIRSSKANLFLVFHISAIYRVRHVRPDFSEFFPRDSENSLEKILMPSGKKFKFKIQANILKKIISNIYHGL